MASYPSPNPPTISSDESPFSYPVVAKGHGAFTYRNESNPPDLPTTCAQSYPLPRTRPSYPDKRKGRIQPAIESTMDNTNSSDARIRASRANAKKIPPAPAPPPAKPFPPERIHPTVSAPKPTSSPAKIAQVHAPPPLKNYKTNPICRPAICRKSSSRILAGLPPERRLRRGLASLQLVFHRFLQSEIPKLLSTRLHERAPQAPHVVIIKRSTNPNDDERVSVPDGCVGSRSRTSHPLPQRACAAVERLVPALPPSGADGGARAA